MATLKDLFLGELADIYDAEKRLAIALPKLAEAATDLDLREALLTHCEETKGHIEKVEAVFAAFIEDAKGTECKVTISLLQEGDELVEENQGEPTINAAIISACQKVENYEIASYGTLIEWAGLLQNDEAVGLLGQILQEEENADQKLTELAVEHDQAALGGEIATDAVETTESDDATGRN